MTWTGRRRIGLSDWLDPSHVMPQGAQAEGSATVSQGSRTAIETRLSAHVRFRWSLLERMVVSMNDFTVWFMGIVAVE